MVLRKRLSSRPRRRMNILRRRANARPLRKTRMPKRKEDYARCVEIQETQIVAVKDNTGESVGAQMSFCLADFQRPQEVAHAYKYYRAAKAELVFIPYFNLAQTQGAGATQLPQLYMSVDRLGNRWIAPTETECLERGISPRVFTKKMKLSWKPNLLQGISIETRQPTDGGGNPLGFDLMGYQNAIPLFNKWLPTQQSWGGSLAPVQSGIVPLGTNPYALRYYGAIYNAAIEGQAPGTNAIVGDIHLKITWEFKGPRGLRTNAPLQEPNPYQVTSSQGNPGAVPNTQPTTYP